MAEAAPNPGSASGDDFFTSVPDSWRAAMTPTGASTPAQPANPAQRITMMEESLRCHAYGWLSLLPLVGICFVFPAVQSFRHVDHERPGWNPAQHLWLRGLVLASFGFWTNLLWWGIVALRLGKALSQAETSHAAVGTVLLSALFFGSAPTLIGLGCAATRWPTRFGAFVHRHRVGLLGLMGILYSIVLLLACQDGIVSNPYEPHPPSDVGIYGWVAGGLVWGFGGFLGLANWRPKWGWWLAWLAGAAGISLCLTGDLSLKPSLPSLAHYVLAGTCVGAGVGAVAAVWFRQRWLALGCFLIALWYLWLLGR